MTMTPTAFAQELQHHISRVWTSAEYDAFLALVDLHTREELFEAEEVGYAEGFDSASSGPK